MTTETVEWIMSFLLIASGLMALAASLGFVRLKDFFQRLHPPALASGGASMCVLLAMALWAWVNDGRLILYPFVIIVLIAITMPVTMSILARAALFRNRTSGRAVPPSLTSATEVVTGMHDSERTGDRKPSAD